MLLLQVIWEMPMTLVWTCFVLNVSYNIWTNNRSLIDDSLFHYFSWIFDIISNIDRYRFVYLFPGFQGSITNTSICLRRVLVANKQRQRSRSFRGRIASGHRETELTEIVYRSPIDGQEIPPPAVFQKEKAVNIGRPTQTGTSESHCGGEGIKRMFGHVMQ